MGPVWVRVHRAVARGSLIPAIGCALIAAACGASGAPAHRTAARLTTPCATIAVAAVARATSLPTRTIVASAFTAPGGEANCRFSARRSSGRSLDVIAELDSAPQAYYRFVREVVEYGQNVLWHSEGAAAYPRNVPHLGLEADWFAAADQLITTDGVRLITVSVNSAPANAPGGAEQIATALARTYIGRLVPPRP
jgi:hypothetical protein